MTDEEIVQQNRNFLSWQMRPNRPGISEYNTRHCPPAVWAYMYGHTSWCPPAGEW